MFGKLSVIYLLLCFIGVIFNSSTAEAEGFILPGEPREGVKLSVGLSRNFHNSSFDTLPGATECCPEFGSGSGWGYVFNASYTFIPANLFSLELGAGYMQLNDSLSHQRKTLINIDGEPLPGTLEHTLSAEISALNIFALVNFFPLKRLYLSAGVKIGAFTNAEYSQAQKLVKPENRGVFLDTGKRTRNENSGKIINISSFFIGIPLRAGFELPMNSANTFRLCPEIHYSIPLNSILGSGKWKITELSFNLGFFFVF